MSLKGCITPKVVLHQIYTSNEVIFPGLTSDAKKDKAGNLITSRPGRLELYKNTYIERLTPKERKQKHQTLQKLRENLFAEVQIVWAAGQELPSRFGHQQ